MARRGGTGSVGSPSGTRIAFAALLALCGALLVRLPALSLPLEGDGVAQGALAQSIATGKGFAIDGVPDGSRAPLWPVVIAIPVASGATVTGAERTTGWLLGALSAALLVLVGARLFGSTLSIASLAALAAAHPALSLSVGGLYAGPDAISSVLALAAILCGVSEGSRARRAALLLAGLLPLCRYDLLPFAVAAAVVGSARASGTSSRVGVLAATLGPTLLWLLRGAFVHASGFAWALAPLGQALSNLLVIAGLVLPAAGLGVLWLFAPRGLADLWSRGSPDRGVLRGWMLGCVAHLLLVVCLATPSGRDDRALSFAASSLRAGVAVVPLVVIAGLAGLGRVEGRTRTVLEGTVVGLSVLLSVLLLSGRLQRALPFGPSGAGRLHLVGEAYDAAVEDAGKDGWIAVDLGPSVEDGVEVFLGDRAPTHRTGVIAAPLARRPGSFPRPPVLPLVDEMPKKGRAILVTDRVLEGVIYTGDRPDLMVGGQGIFHRVLLREVGGGRLGTLTLHEVRRPPR